MTRDERLRVYIGPRRKRKGGGYYSRWPYRFKIPGQSWVHGTGAFTEASTRRLVDRLIQERLDPAMNRPARCKPTEPVSVHAHVMDYLAWGRHQGGRGGLPWSPEHYKHRESQLREWMRVLVPYTLEDIHYDAFSTANTEKLARGVAPNTVNHHAWALVSFMRWCHERGRVPGNPLEKFSSLDRRPRRERGAFTMDEFRMLLGVAPLGRGLIYRMAVLTGFRRTALASLTVGEVDWKSGLVTLRWGNSKNRRTITKPLPARLLEDMRKVCRNKGPEEPLLEFSPKQASRTIHKDMLKAGIPIERNGLKRDFHSLKVSLGTLLDDMGTLPEITQRALDHASYRQTQAYIKRDLSSLRNVVTELENRLEVEHKFHTSTLITLHTAVFPENYGERGSSSHSASPLPPCLPALTRLPSFPLPA